MRNRASPRGFTLLEVIVALAILSVSAAVLMRIFASSSSIASVSDHYYEAVQIAETQMARLLAEDHLSTSRSGRVGEQFRWRAKISRYDPDINNPLFKKQRFIDDPEVIYNPYHYEVEVFWGNNHKRSVRLSTIQLGVVR